MVVTEEWVKSVSDEQGLTKGQKYLLSVWMKQKTLVDYEVIPDQVANYIKHCKGYRSCPQHLFDRLH